MGFISIFKMLRKPSKVISLRIRAYNEGKWVGAFSGAIILSQIVPIKSLLAKLSHINWHKVSKRSPSRHFRNYRIYPETKLFHESLIRSKWNFYFLAVGMNTLPLSNRFVPNCIVELLRNENFLKNKNKLKNWYQKLCWS